MQKEVPTLSWANQKLAGPVGAAYIKSWDCFHRRQVDMPRHPERKRIGDALEFEDAGTLSSVLTKYTTQN